MNVPPKGGDHPLFILPLVFLVTGIFMRQISLLQGTCVLESVVLAQSPWALIGGWVREQVDDVTVPLPQPEKLVKMPTRVGLPKCQAAKISVFCH